MFSVYVFSDLLLLLFMLISTSSMLEFHMIVVAVVMLNILELTMEIMPNYPTDSAFNVTSCLYSYTSR